MLADRALFWPRHGALIVADLHLEKASWYAALGQPLPPYDSHDTLDRLAALADQTGARAIWCLGDSFHDRNAATRIVPAVRSEEHTSELQSLMRISYAVFCLKKKKTNTKTHTTKFYKSTHTLVHRQAKLNT